MGRRYHILDVFTDIPLAGNPLAVVLDAQGLDEARMQAIAREFNLSETVFVTPPRDPINAAAIRIFTPTLEMPFAGHPTVGAAVLLATLRAPELLAREDVGLRLEEKIGVVSCSVRHRKGEAAHARFEVPSLAESRGAAPDTGVLAMALGLAPDDIAFEGHKPSRFSAGIPFTFVPVASLDALGRARETPTGLSAGAYYLYTPVEHAETRSFRSRMFASSLGVAEDPATGSAAAAFAGVLARGDRLLDGPHDCFLHQGVEMGRPSKIGVAFSLAGGRLVETVIGGSAVLVAEGVLNA